MSYYKQLFVTIFMGISLAIFNGTIKAHNDFDYNQSVINLDTLLQDEQISAVYQALSQDEKELFQKVILECTQIWQDAQNKLNVLLKRPVVKVLSKKFTNLSDLKVTMIVSGQ